MNFSSSKDQIKLRSSLDPVKIVQSMSFHGKCIVLITVYIFVESKSKYRIQNKDTFHKIDLTERTMDGCNVYILVFL